MRVVPLSAAGVVLLLTGRACADSPAHAPERAVRQTGAHTVRRFDALPARWPYAAARWSRLPREQRPGGDAWRRRLEAVLRSSCAALL